MGETVGGDVAPDIGNERAAALLEQLCVPLTEGTGVDLDHRIDPGQVRCRREGLQSEMVAGEHPLIGEIHDQIAGLDLRQPLQHQSQGGRGPHGPVTIGAVYCGWIGSRDGQADTAGAHNSGRVGSRGPQGHQFSLRRKARGPLNADQPSGREDVVATVRIRSGIVSLKLG